MKTAAQYIKERYPFYDENIEHKDVELNGERIKELIHRVQQETAAEIKKRCKEECEKKRFKADPENEIELDIDDEIYNQAVDDCQQAIDRMEIE